MENNCISIKQQTLIKHCYLNLYFKIFLQNYICILYIILPLKFKLKISVKDRKIPFVTLKAFNQHPTQVAKYWGGQVKLKTEYHLRDSPFTENRLAVSHPRPSHCTVYKSDRPRNYVKRCDLLVIAKPTGHFTVFNLTANTVL